MYAKYLTQHGISTVEAQDGLHGFATAVSETPDIIAVELGIPEQDIVDMCCRLKQDDSTRHIPIVAISSLCKVDVVNRALNAGCVSVLLKPCMPHELLDEIRRVLALSKPVA